MGRTKAHDNNNSFDFSTSSDVWFEEQSLDEFAARKSSRVPASPIIPDHDTWVEHFSVSESQRIEGKIILRSYFQSVSTGRRLWDEPPTGASEIQYATDHARQMAIIQLNDYTTGDNFGVENSTESSSLFKALNYRFLRKGKKNQQTSEIDAGLSSPHVFDDRDVQTAIAISLNQDFVGVSENRDFTSNVNNEEFPGASSCENAPRHGRSHPPQESFSQNIEEDIEIARAISLSLMK